MAKCKPKKSTGKTPAKKKITARCGSTGCAINQVYTETIILARA